MRVLVIWSLVLAAIGLLGLWLIGDGRKIGFLFGVLAQVAWAAYAVMTGQWGFILTCVAYGWVYLRGYKKAVRNESE
jgi:hypothetical protein